MVLYGVTRNFFFQKSFEIIQNANTKFAISVGYAALLYHRRFVFITNIGIEDFSWWHNNKVKRVNI